jgi:uncharacterized protein with PIN domain
MTPIVVDTSAIMAVLLAEPDRTTFHERLLLGSGVLGLGHATKAATRAPSRALPRRRALCTNWKKPR